MNHLTCDGEHLLVHKLRNLLSFVPELDFVAEKTSTQGNPLWAEMQAHRKEIDRRVASLSRTLAYNDFYWTNLVVARDYSSALILDFNLLGQGYAWGDV